MMANLGKVQKVLEVVPVTDSKAEAEEFEALREEVAMVDSKELTDA